MRQFSYIINETCRKKKLPQICGKIIFIKFLYNLTTKVLLQFNYLLLKLMAEQ